MSDDKIDWICIHCGQTHYRTYEKVDVDKPIKCHHCGLLRKRMGKSVRDSKKAFESIFLKHRIAPFEGTTTNYPATTRSDMDKKCCCPCPSWYS